MEKHHLAWLESHPHKDAAWLMQAIDAGFDVHHMDGDHGNNAPDNLVLVEHSDHMKFHGGINFSRGFGSWEEASRKVVLGKDAYSLRAEGLAWQAVAERIGYDKAHKALNVAARYAKYHSLEWPIGGKRRKIPKHTPACEMTKVLKSGREVLRPS